MPLQRRSPSRSFAHRTPLPLTALLVLLTLWALAPRVVEAQGVTTSAINGFVTGEDGTRRYYRYQVTLDMGNDDMDDAGQTNLFALKALAKREIGQNSAEIDRLCAQLTAAAP